MKATIAWILSAVLLVGIVGGATVLYNNYMEESKNAGTSDSKDDVPPGVVILAGKDKQNASTTAKESQDEVTESRTETAETEEKAPETTHTHSHDTSPEITVTPSEDETLEQTAEDSEQITEGEPAETVETATERISETETEKVTEKATEKVTEAPTEKQTEEETESEYVSPYLAPDFTVYDINGKAVKLSDFRGQPIVLNFWARGCIYCVKEMPDFQAAYEKYGDEVVFLMVCHVGFNNTTPAYEQKLLDSNGYTFPAYYDTSYEAVYAYGINALPQTWFIDREFDLYTRIEGMASAESLEYCIQLILQ